MTLTDAVLAFPIAFYMAKVAGRRGKALLVVAVLVPLWSSYLVKVLSWRTMLSANGVINWALAPLGLHGPGYGNTAVWLVMSYLWLPYMILPVFAGLERIPNSLIGASEDLGGSPFTTFRRVILPLAFPAVVAGSIVVMVGYLLVARKLRSPCCSAPWRRSPSPATASSAARRSPSS